MLIEDRLIALGFSEEEELRNMFHPEEKIYIIDPMIWIGVCPKKNKLYFYEDKEMVRTFSADEITGMNYKEIYENGQIFVDFMRFNMKNGGNVTISQDGLRWKKF